MNTPTYPELLDLVPDVDTVPLDALLAAVQTFVGDRQRVTITRDGVEITALGNIEFACTASEAQAVLEAADTLERYRQPPF